MAIGICFLSDCSQHFYRIKHGIWHYFLTEFIYSSNKTKQNKTLRLVQGLIKTKHKKTLNPKLGFFSVLFFNLWCTYIDDDSLEGLTRFDWSLERKVEKFKNIAIFSWTSRPYCSNLVISEKKPSTHFLHENPLYDDPH